MIVLGEAKMRLYIRECNHCKRRIYLSIIAPTRERLAGRIGYSFEIECPYCRKKFSYHRISEVFAEQGPPATPAGALLGGLIGLIGGPSGMIIGGTLGTLWGANADEEERKKVNRFNRS